MWVKTTQKLFLGPRWVLFPSTWVWTLLRQIKNLTFVLWEFSKSGNILAGVQMGNFSYIRVLFGTIVDL